VTIDILCKVVDNYGDIGVVFRLARALSELPDAPRLRLVVSDLEAFHHLEPLVDRTLAIQSIRGWTVIDWSGPTAETRSAYEAVYKEEIPLFVLECFACGRPDWFESMLFDETQTTVRTIMNIEYLTAEAYADEMHLMPSITRSATVKKHMFMPGFTSKTGGLILDNAFVQALGCRANSSRLQVFVFSYERDYTGIVSDLSAFSRRHPVVAHLAHGRSQACFIDAWEKAGQPFPVVRLPFLPQEEWDRVLISCDFLIVRGEDSMARAALSGKPFLWQAYPQENAHQLVKVQALLDTMKPFFDADIFAPLESAFLAFNDRLADGPEVRGTECVMPLLELALLDKKGSGCHGFSSFASGLFLNGNLAANLMTFIRKVV